jgi:hypothetical protein
LRFLTIAAGALRFCSWFGFMFMFDQIVFTYSYRSHEQIFH